ncbi:hypothetical protein ODJ79_21790 [Actinoplanes sp. KI2]|uniref:effector-associated constant component EACC1 n=1 Tax=Actinoplanes sp. KI2 TaxID=2983315 RepID=UPI0021D60970|nr:hypothetical protein [Actinoplanes sp. KI2]MCU7726370.1 hypothetical protein [Actinoplanes sp. KI2]
MDVSITAGDAEALRGLRTWLAEEAALRGRVTARESPPPEGTLGPLLEALVVAVGPGGVAVALVTGLVSWLRQQRGDLTVRVERPDGGSFELSAQRVKGLDMAAVRAEVERLSDEIDPG